MEQGAVGRAGPDPTGRPKSSAAMRGGRLSIAGLVVTYNRKDLLRQNLAALQAQTRPLEEIIVVDNGCRDGTGEMLAAEFPSVHVVVIPENNGFTTGAAAGLQFAFDRGHDWMWIMDDDALPEPDSLDHLCGSIGSIGEERFCLYACYLDPKENKFSEQVTFIPGGRKVVITEWDEARRLGSLLEGTGGPFLGLLVPRSVVSVVGLPRPETYIWGDFEYIDRLRRAGYRIYYNTSSILRHPSAQWIEWHLPSGIWRLQRPIWRPIRLPLAPVWKQYYGIRNMVDHLMRSPVLPRPVGFLKALYAGTVFTLMVLSNSRKKSAALRFCFRGFRDGLLGRMGKRLTDQEVRESLTAN